MSFDHPWVLLALLLPLGWAAWEWRVTGAASRAGAEGGRLRLHRARAGRSAPHGLRDQGRGGRAGGHVGQRLGGGSGERIGDRERSGTRARPALDAGHAVRARHARGGAGREGQGRLASAPHRRTRRDAARIWKRAIRDGAAALPAGMVPRLLLISDGNENLGSVARAIWQAQQLGFPSTRCRWPDVPSPACGWKRRDSGAGLQRRAFPHRCGGGSAATPPRHGGTDRRRQDDRHAARWNWRPG